MKKLNYVAATLSTFGLSLILVAMLMLNGMDLSTVMLGDSVLSFSEVDNDITSYNDNVITNGNVVKMSALVQEDREIAPAVTLRVEVFEGLTMDELSDKLNRVLGGVLAGKGNLIATYSLSKGVNPYIVTAIMIHETGNGTSSMARNCNNVAGQKGAPACMGSYKGYSSIDDGIRGAIDNLYNNYYARGLNTVESIGPRYAESNTWVSKINGYITKIRNS